MNSDTKTGPHGADALQKLTELVWRAELLVDVEERVEQVICRGEELPYDGPSEQVTDWRRQVCRLLALVEQPPASAEMGEAIATASRLVQLLERHGQGVGGADTAAPPTSP
ncbi:MULTISPECIES: hypothetical protein [unclassified Streptomyces]|uniref:hypothetical protein n=1 Tax=unclassified Streptomyces TaxID=2593676 RepID=UPI00081F5781|nr:MULTISPECIES: hypothetical protein [unclassified Streptomyces]MYZ41150.1 hypothetical protein [Streptomyces sp. SID4917]SCG09550.1 hypothetical protein GA0115259_115933 [Streptomyces sp. MnatMP-M17]